MKNWARLLIEVQSLNSNVCKLYKTIKNLKWRSKTWRKKLVNCAKPPWTKKLNSKSQKLKTMPHRNISKTTRNQSKNADF